VPVKGLVSMKKTIMAAEIVADLDQGMPDEQLTRKNTNFHGMVRKDCWLSY
jgi:hypothetical protein